MRRLDGRRREKAPTPRCSPRCTSRCSSSTRRPSSTTS
jgi:hypothetical protein